MAMGRHEIFETYQHRGVENGGSRKYLPAEFCTVTQISGEQVFFLLGIRVSPKFHLIWSLLTQSNTIVFVFGPNIL